MKAGHLVIGTVKFLHTRLILLKLCNHGCWQTNRLKHQKPGERALYEAIRERHSVRAASRFSLKVLRFEGDLCDLNGLWNDAWIEANFWRLWIRLNRSIGRSRRRKGKCEFSTLLFAHRCLTCVSAQPTSFAAALSDRSLSVTTSLGAPERRIAFFIKVPLPVTRLFSSRPSPFNFACELGDKLVPSVPDSFITFPLGNWNLKKSWKVKFQEHFWNPFWNSRCLLKIVW